MKLSKSQRLFLAVARTEYLTQRLKFVIDCTRPYDWPQKKIEILRYETGELKRLRALRKKLLREALEAARSETTAHYMNGINEVLRLIERRTHF
jgi:hypothetical protein